MSHIRDTEQFILICLTLVQKQSTAGGQLKTDDLTELLRSDNEMERNKDRL